MENERGYQKYRRKRSMCCLVTALILAALLTGWQMRERSLMVEARAESAQRELAGEVLRFHVLANSDSQEDQQVKMQVKEAVLEYMDREMPSEQKAGLSGTKAWVKAHLGQIRDLAEETLREAGSRDKVTAELTNAYFPAKTYGDVTFPAGEYEALRICIGQAQGQNWWCCLYPDLCFIDAVHAVVPEEGKEKLRQVLDEDAYDMVTATSEFKIKWFFLQ